MHITLGTNNLALKLKKTHVNITKYEIFKNKFMQLIQDLYLKHYKILLTEINKDYNKYRTTYVHGMADTILL